MALAYIGLGSNLGDGRKNLLRAWGLLQKKSGNTLGFSSPFLTEPEGMESDYWFTNAVGLLQTELAPQDLLENMLAVEVELGRDRLKGRDRTVDLDLLYYDGLILREEGLVLPHPEIENRLFVLAPLAELAPSFIHPINRQTSMKMLQQVKNGGKVERMFWEDV